MNCLKRVKEYLKSFLKLKNEFGVSINEYYIDLYLKEEYKNLNNLKHIKLEGDCLVIDLTDINDKNINLYVGNTLVNNEKAKNIKILCGNESIYLQDYNTIEYDNLYVKTNGKVKLSSIDVKNNVSILANEIDSEVDLHVVSTNQNYNAKKISIKHGFLDASNTIKLSSEELKFFNSGVLSNNLIIDSNNLVLHGIRNFEVDDLVISANKVVGNNSTISANHTDITSNECSDLNIISNPTTTRNKVKVKI